MRNALLVLLVTHVLPASAIAGNLSAPLLVGEGDLDGREKWLLAFDVLCSDKDGPVLLALTTNGIFPAPTDFPFFEDLTGVSPISSRFLWTPGCEDAGSYTAVFRCNDGQFLVQEDVPIEISEVGECPIFADGLESMDTVAWSLPVPQRLRTDRGVSYQRSVMH